jgi:hypothetical protein
MLDLSRRSASVMNLHRMITELQDEKQRLDEAIEALERLSSDGRSRRRGRPPNWLKTDTEKDSPAEKVSLAKAKKNPVSDRTG